MANFPSVLTKHFKDSGFDPIDLKAYLPSLLYPNTNPVVFVPFELPAYFDNQEDTTETVQTNTIKLGELNETTLLRSIDVYLNAPVTDLRIRIANQSANQVLAYVPSLSDWDNNTGISVGSGRQTIEVEPIILPSNAQLSFDLEGTNLSLRGKDDKPFISFTAQRGTLKTVATDSTLSDGDTPINHRGLQNQVLEVLNNNVSSIDMAQSNVLYCINTQPIMIDLPIIRKSDTGILEANEVRSGHTWTISNTGSTVAYEWQNEIHSIGRNTWVTLIAYIDQHNNPCYTIISSGALTV